MHFAKKSLPLLCSVASAWSVQLRAHTPAAQPTVTLDQELLAREMKQREAQERRQREWDEQERQRVERYKQAEITMQKEQKTREAAAKVAAAAKKAKKGKLPKVEKMFGAGLYCPLWLIDSAPGGALGIYHGAKFVQDFLDRIEAGKQDFPDLKTQCETLKTGLLAKGMKPRGLSRDDIVTLRDRLNKELRSKDVIWNLLAHSADTGIPCKVKTRGITVAFGLSGAVGRANYTCETPLGVRHKYKGWYFGGGGGIGIMGQRGKHIENAWKETFWKQGSMEFKWSEDSGAVVGGIARNLLGITGVTAGFGISGMGIRTKAKWYKEGRPTLSAAYDILNLAAYL